MTTSNPVLCGSIAARPGVFGVAMHSAGYRALGLDYTYVAFGTEDTGAAVAAMRALGIRGLGVTTPHKLRIGAYLDDLTETARAIGAVNTVVNHGGRLVGHNVDWMGAIDAVREVLEPRGCRAVVVGAGGGARAIAYGLGQAGADVVIYNRDAGHGADLADRLGARYGGPPSALADVDGYDLLVHATPVGFHAPDDMLVAEHALRPDTVVFDAVAVPVRTACFAPPRRAAAAPYPASACSFIRPCGSSSFTLAGRRRSPCWSARSPRPWTRPARRPARLFHPP